MRIALAWRMQPGPASRGRRAAGTNRNEHQTHTTMTTAFLESADVTPAESASALLTTHGAIAVLADEPRPILIGDLQCVDGRELLLFPAFGDAPTDAHRVPFDEAVVHYGGKVTFLCGGHVVAAIERIEDADIDDPDDYRVAWQLWREVAPVYRPLIERCYEAVRSSGG